MDDYVHGLTYTIRELESYVKEYERPPLLPDDYVNTEFYWGIPTGRLNIKAKMYIRDLLHD